MTNVISIFLVRSDISLAQALIKINITICSLESMKNDYEFEGIWKEAVDIYMINDIDEPGEYRKRNVPQRLDDGDIISTTISSIKDNCRIGSFFCCTKRNDRQN